MRKVKDGKLTQEQADATYSSIKNNQLTCDAAGMGQGGRGYGMSRVNSQRMGMGQGYRYAAGLGNGGCGLGLANENRLQYDVLYNVRSPIIFKRGVRRI